MELLRLEELAGGALQEKAERAIREIVDNMQDPNTNWKNKRTLTMKLAFHQNEDRDDATCEISVETKLAQPKPVEAKFSIGKDLRNGELYMAEYGPQIKGQMSLDLHEKVIGNDVVDTETGEVTRKVADFRVKEA